MSFINELDEIENDPRYAQLAPADRTAVLDNWEKAASSGKSGVEAAAASSAARTLLEARQSKLKARLPASPLGTLADVPPPLAALTSDPRWGTLEPTVRKQTIDNWAGAKAQTAIAAGFRPSESVSTYQEIVAGQVMAEAPEKPAEAIQARLAADTKEVFDIARDPTIRAGGFRAGKVRDKFVVNPALALAGEDEYSKAVDEADASPVEKIRAKALYGAGRATSLASITDITTSAVSDSRPLTDDEKSNYWRNVNAKPSERDPGFQDNTDTGRWTKPTVVIGGKTVDFEDAAEIAFTPSRLSNYDEKGGSQESLFSTNEGVRKAAEIRTAQQLARHVLPVIGADAAAARILAEPEGPEAKALVEAHRDNLKRQLWVTAGNINNNVFEKGRLLSDGTPVFNPNWARSNPDPKDIEDVVQKVGITASVDDVKASIKDEAAASAARLVLRAGLEEQDEWLTSANDWSPVNPVRGMADILVNTLPQKFREYVAAKQQKGETDPLKIVDAYEKEYGMLTDDISIGLRKAVSQTKSVAAGVSGILGTAAEQFGGANPASKFLAGLAADIIKETNEAEQLQSELTGSNAGFGSTVTQSIATEAPFIAAGFLAGRAASAARYAATRAATPAVVEAAIRRKMATAASMTPELAAAAEALISSGSGILKTYFGLQASRSFGGVYASTYTAQKERALRMGKTEEEADRDARVTSILPSIAGGVATAVLMKMFPGGTEAAMRSLATKESVESVLARAGATVGTKAGNNFVVNAFRNVQALRSTRDFVRKYFSQDALKRIGLKTFAGMSDEALEETVDEAFQGMLGSVYDERMTLQDVVGNALQAGGIGALIGGGSAGIAAYKENLKVIRNARKNKPVPPDVAPVITELEANGDTATAEALRRAASSPDNFQVALDKLNAVDKATGKGRFAFAFDSDAAAEDELPVASYVVGTPDPDPVKAAANMAAIVANVEAAIAADPDLKDVLIVSADAANGRVTVSPSIDAVASWAADSAPSSSAMSYKEQLYNWMKASIDAAETAGNPEFDAANAKYKASVDEMTAAKSALVKNDDAYRLATASDRTAKSQKWQDDFSALTPELKARVLDARAKSAAVSQALEARRAVLEKMFASTKPVNPKAPKAAKDKKRGTARSEQKKREDEERRQRQKDREMQDAANDAWWREVNGEAEPAPPAATDEVPDVVVGDLKTARITASKVAVSSLRNSGRDTAEDKVEALLDDAVAIITELAEKFNARIKKLAGQTKANRDSAFNSAQSFVAELQEAMEKGDWATFSARLGTAKDILKRSGLKLTTGFRPGGNPYDVFTAPLPKTKPAPAPKAASEPKAKPEKAAAPPLEDVDGIVLPAGATDEQKALFTQIKTALKAFPESSRVRVNKLVTDMRAGITNLADQLAITLADVKASLRSMDPDLRTVVAKAVGFDSYAALSVGWVKLPKRKRVAKNKAKTSSNARAAADTVKTAPEAAPPVGKKPARQRAVPPAPKPDTAIPSDWKLRTGPELMDELRKALRREPTWGDVLYRVPDDLKNRVTTKVAESGSGAQSNARFEALRLANHAKIVAALDTEEDPDAASGKLEIPAEDRDSESERTPAEVAVALGTAAESGAEASFVATTPSSVAKKTYDKLQSGILSEFTWKIYWWTLGRQMARSTTDEQRAKIRARASRLFDAVVENGIWQNLEGRKEEFLYALENPLTKAPGEVSAITTAREILKKKLGDLKGLLVNTAKKRIVSGSTANQTANENAQISGQGVAELIPAEGSKSRGQIIEDITSGFVARAKEDPGVIESELSDRVLKSAGREFALRQIAKMEGKAWTGEPDSEGAKSLARVFNVAEGDELKRIAGLLGTREPETRNEELEAVRAAFDAARSALGGDIRTNLSGVLKRIAADKSNPLSELAGILVQANAASYVAGVKIIDDPARGPAFYDPAKRTITFNRASASTRGFTDDIVHEVLHAATDSFLSTVHPEGSPEAEIVQRILDLQEAVRKRFKAAAPSWKEALGSETILESGFFADLVALRASTLLDRDKRAWLEENAVEGYEADMTEDDVADLFLEASIKDASARRDGLVEILRDFEYALGESGTPEYYPSGISKEFLTLMYTSPVFQEAVQNAPELNARDAEGTFKKFVSAVRSFVGTLIKGKTTAPARVPDYSVLRDLLAAQGEVRPVSARRPGPVVAPIIAPPVIAPPRAPAVAPPRAPAIAKPRRPGAAPTPAEAAPTPAEAAPTPAAATEPEASSKLRRLYDNGTLVPLTGIPRRRRPDLGGEAEWNGLALEMDGRVLVIAKVGALDVPFYKSSGQAKKDGVSKGKWYPVFGADPKTGWINKTTSGTGGGMANYFGMPELKAVAEILDSQLGDIDVFEGSGIVPLVQSVSPSATNPYDENTGKDPIDSRALDAFNKLHTFSDLVTPNNSPGTTKNIEAAVARLLGVPVVEAAPAPLAVVRKVANFSVPPLYRTREFTSVFGQAIDRAVANAGFSRDFSQVIVEVEATALDREAKAEDEAVASLAPVTKIEEAGNLASLPDDATVEEITEAAPKTSSAAVALAAVYKEFGAWSAAVKRRLGAAMGRFARTMWNGLKAIAAIGLTASMYLGPLSPDTAAEGSPTAEQLEEELTQDELVAASVAVGAVTQPNATPSAETRPAPELTEVERSTSFRAGATAALGKFDFQNSHYVQFGDEFNAMALEATPLTPAMKELASLMGQKEGTRATGPNRLLAPIFRMGGIRGSQDEIPWCAMAVSYALTKAGAPTHNVLAGQFLSAGTRVDIPQVGDVVVFNKRNEKDNSIDTGTAGHVGFFMADLGNYILVLDGNVGDKVAITAMSKRRFMQYRRITTPGTRTPFTVTLSQGAANRMAAGFAAEDDILEAQEQIQDVIEDEHAAFWGTAPRVLGTRARTPVARVTLQMDAEYLAAVKAGDMEKAQRMVDAAARAAGYHSGPVFHGSPFRGFTRFKKRPRSVDWSVSTGNAFHFNSNRAASQYYEGEEGLGETRRFYLRARFAVLEVDRNTRRLVGDRGEVLLAQSRVSDPGNFDSLPAETLLADIEVITDATKSMLLGLGYSGVMESSYAGTETEYAVFSPEQIKSADPVTYDDAGNIIPLSQRFNADSPSILYTRTPVARLRGDQISLSSALSPVERVWKTEHELGHWLYRDTAFRESFTRLWNSLTDDERKTIDADVTALYSAEEADEERQVRALEFIRRKAAGKSAWKKFTDAVASLWKKLTGRRHENPEELAARMVAVARHEVFVLRRVMPEIVDAINLSTAEDGAVKESGDRYSLANRVRGTSDKSDLAFLNQNAAWVDEYDRANPKNKDSSDTLASEYLRTALDRVVESTGQSSREANTVLTNLRKDKLSEALRYFDGNPGYRPVEAAAVVGVLLRKRIDWLAPSEDAQGNVLPGGLRSQKMESNNEHIGSAFNAAIAAGAVREIRQGARPDKAYEAAVEAFAKTDADGGRKTDRRGWVSYAQGSDAKVLEADTSGAAGRWCIGAGAASGYLSKGGFEIFFDDDGRARVAIHHSDGGINEISGSFGDQNLRDGEGEIAVAKAEELGLSGTQDVLTDIDRKRRFMAFRNGGPIDEDLMYVDKTTGEFVWDTQRRHRRYGGTPLFEPTQEDIARLNDYVASSGIDRVAFLERQALSGDPARVKKAAENPWTPIGALTDLSNSRDVSVRSLVSRNPSIPVSALEKLAEDEDKHIRKIVATNPSSPGSALEKLAEDEDMYVRRIVAANTSTPGSVLEKLAEDEDMYVRQTVAKNPSSPGSVLEKLATNKSEDVRMYVAENTSTPGSVLEKLATDESNDVRKTVSRNTSTPGSVLEKLATDEYMIVRKNVAANTSTPGSVLEKLATDENEDVRMYVAENTSSPGSVLEKLATDEEYYVRRIVAANTSTPGSVLEKLATDESEDVRMFVARNPSSPGSVLEKLATEVDPDVRESVAKNPSSPGSVLEKLATDEDEYVRVAAAENPSSPGRVLGTRRRESPVRRLPQALRSALPEDEIQDIEAMYRAASGESRNSPFTLDDAVYAGRSVRMALTWLLNEDLRRLISNGNSNEGAKAADLSYALAVLTDSGGEVAGKSVTEIYGMQTAPGIREAPLKAFTSLGLTVRSRIASTPGFFTPRALRIDSRFHATTTALSAARNIFAGVAGTASPDTLTWKLMTAKDPAKVLSLVPEASREALEAARATLRSNYAEITTRSLGTITGMPELWDLASRLETLKEAAVNPAATADSRGMMIPRLAAVLKEAGLDTAEILPVRQQMATYKDDAARFSSVVSEAARTAVNRFAMGRKLPEARLEFMSAGAEALAFRDKAQGLVYKVKLPQRMGADTGFSFDVAPPSAAPEEGEVLLNLTEGLGRSPLWQELNEMHTAVPGIVDHEVVGFTDFGALITVQKDVRGQAYSPSEDAGVIEEWMEVTGARKVPAGRLYSEDFAKDAVSNAFTVTDAAGFTRILADVRPANASVLNGAFLLFDPAISPAVEGEAKGMLGTRARERTATPEELLRRFNLNYDTLSASEKAVYDKVIGQIYLRNPWLAVLARRMREGRISAGEYADAAELVDPFVVKGHEEIPSYASIRKYMEISKPAPTPEKLSKIGEAVPEGTVYEFRIDIPTYNASAEAGDAVYVITVHKPVPEGATRVGDTVSYVGIARVLNPTFITRSISGKGDASMIAAGSGKTPLATVKGVYQSISEVPSDITDANVWTEVGYNPIRSSYFVDVRSKQAVVGGSEAIMIGPRVFVKDAVLEPRNRDAVPEGRADDNKMRVLYTRARSSRRTIPIVSNLLSIGKDKTTRNKEVEAALGITNMSRWISEKGKWGDLYKVQKELENNVQRAVTLTQTLFSTITSRMDKAGLSGRNMTAQQKRQAEDVNTVLGTIDTLRDEQAAQAAEKERSRARRRVAYGVAQRRKFADQMTSANRATELVSIATEANVSYARIETEYEDAILQAEITATRAFVQKQAEAAQRLRADNLVPVLEAAQNLRKHLNELSTLIQSTTGADSRIRAHYNARFGIHLSRYYEIHDNPAYAAWLWSNDPEAVKVRNAGLTWIRNARATKFAAELKSRMPGATTQEIERAAKALASKLDNSGLMLELEDIIQKHMNRGGVGGVGMPGLLNGSILMERMNVPQELRTLLGEYKDNVAVAARTALEMGVYYANYVYLDGIRVELQNRQNARNARITELENRISPTQPLTQEEDAELTRLKRTMFITHDPAEATKYGLEEYKPGSSMISKAAFGPLQGFYGPAITIEAMRDLEGGGGTNAILNGYAELLGITMKSFTVWNVRGQARNFLSSIAFIPASGHLAIPVWRKSGLSGDNKASAFFKQFGALGNARLKARIEAVGLEKAMAEFTDMYVKRGIVGGSDAAVFREEMRKVAGKDYGAAVSRVLAQYNASAATVTTAAVPFAEVFKTIDRFMTEVHRGSDDYFKKILFELEYAARLEEFGVKVEKGLPVMTDKAARRIIQVYGGRDLLTPANLAEVGTDEKAKALLLMEVVSAEATFSKIPYYNRLPEVVNAFKRQKLGLASAPFISWPAAIWSQPYKAFKTYQQDRAVPETRDRALKTAISYVATAIGWNTFVGTTLTAIIWALYQIGLGDEDKKIRPVFELNSDQSRALQDFLNKDFYKYRSIVLLGMRGDNPVWADVSWMTPWSTITDVGTPFFHPRALESGTDFADAMKASIDKVLKTVLSPQIPISNAFDALTADDFRTKNASFGEKLLKVAGAVAAPLVPMTLKDMSKAYYAAGTERGLTESVSMLTGLKINETDIRDVLAKTARSVAAQDSDTMDRYRRLLTNGRADDIGKLEDTYQEGMNDMRRLYLDLYQKISSAAVFIPAADVNKIVREEGKGLGFARLAELEKGVLSGWKPGQTTLERAARTAQKEGGDDRVRKSNELVEQYGVQPLQQ